MSRTLFALVVAAACLAASPMPAQAQDPIHKLGRGLANFGVGWIELPKRVAAGRYADNPLTGIGGGLVNGAILTLLRVGVGAYEIVTFPLPYPEHYASPYEGMEMSDYAWD